MFVPVGRVDDEAQGHPHEEAEDGGARGCGDEHQVGRCPHAWDQVRACGRPGDKRGRVSGVEN